MGTVRTAVLPVAGLGTRFLPVTKAVPKEMLPLGDRPCIEYVVAEAVEAGIERVVFVSSRGKDALVDYFDRSPALEANLEANNKHALLAIVDVLLHDPLECWKMSDEKRKEKTHAAGGDDSSVSMNLDALLIRKTIKDKLEGLVRGELLGVQGQVKQLISEAKAPENLSLLFQGWGAWY